MVKIKLGKAPQEHGIMSPTKNTILGAVLVVDFLARGDVTGGF
ncbi:hypothetical protein ACFLUU_02765 [Chloroflexota bacterium]